MNGNDHEPDGATRGNGADVRLLRPPIPVPVWPISGRYAGAGESYRLEAMLEVDSARGVALLTLDFYGLDGDPGAHIGACVLRTSNIVTDADYTVIRGMARFTFAAAAPLIELRVERRSVLRRRAPATIIFLSALLVPGARYLCEFVASPRRAQGSEASPMGSVLPFVRPLDGTTG